MSRPVVAVKRRIRRGLERLAARRGYALHPRKPMPPPSTADAELWRAVTRYTMTSETAVYALADGVRYIVANGIPGAIVECGVWRGGSMMAVARVLLELGETDRDLYLFDTFEGMPAPTSRDIEWGGDPALELLAGERRDDDSTLWAQAPLERVRSALHATGYPTSKIHFVPGRVEETIPDAAPASIAILRLDTDWYESTKHELNHLYPRLASGGVLIIDDYGWWQGAREATDEYFREAGRTPFLVRVDDAGVRLCVKP